MYVIDPSPESESAGTSHQMRGWYSRLTCRLAGHMDDQSSSTGADLLARKKSRLAAGNTDSGIDLAKRRFRNSRVN